MGQNQNHAGYDSSASELHHAPPTNSRHALRSSLNPDTSLDEMATLQAEIDELDRQRQLLVLQQQRDSKRAELEHLRGTGRLQAVSSTSATPLETCHHPASSSSDSTARSLAPATATSNASAEGQQSEPPPAYSTSHRTTSGTPDLAGTTAPKLAPAQPDPPATFDSPARLSRTHLPKPIAIPANSAAIGSPFMRAYPPWLTSYGVDRITFLGFLDDLNRCAVASPPVQILGLAGNIVSFVPSHIAQIVGSSVNVAADLATVGISKGRVEMCLRAANSQIFVPRGLKAEVARLDAVAKIARMPILDPATGKIDKSAPVLAPLEVPSQDGLQSISSHQRTLDALGTWIAPLDVAPLPEIKKSDNILGKLHTAASERQRKKEEKKVLKDRGKTRKHYERDSREATEEFEKEMRKLEKEETKVRSKESAEKLQKQLARIERKREKLARELEKETAKVEEDKMKDDKEEKGVRKILWLLIRNIDDPSGPGPNPDLESLGPSTDTHGT